MHLKLGSPLEQFLSSLGKISVTCNGNPVSKPFEADDGFGGAEEGYVKYYVTDRNGYCILDDNLEDLLVHEMRGEVKIWVDVE